MIDPKNYSGYITIKYIINVWKNFLLINDVRRIV